MKKILIILGIIAVAMLVYIFRPSNGTLIDPTMVTPDFANMQDGTYCFVYHQVATTDAPYAVDEQVSLTYLQDTVTGIKKGTQAGPDMANGYEGTLTGIKKDGNTILVDFAYIVEGSQNIESEEYVVTQDGLIKHRYPLVEQNGKLVPDKTQPKRDIVYTPILCPTT